MEKKKVTGSFGLPPEMEEAVRKSKSKARGETQEQEEEFVEQPKKKSKKEYKDSESIPEEVEAKVEKEEVVEEKSDEERLSDLAEEIKKDLEVEFDEDDLYKLYVSVLEKEVAIVKGKVYAIFRTLNLEEDKIVVKARDAAMNEYTLEASIANETAIKTLNYAVLGLGPKGKVKSLGDTPEEREKSLDKINTLMIERLMNKLRDFSFLCKFVQGQEDELKKS